VKPAQPNCPVWRSSYSFSELKSQSKRNFSFVGIGTYTASVGDVPEKRKLQEKQAISFTFGWGEWRRLARKLSQCTL
jgi:hypothetical protein